MHPEEMPSSPENPESQDSAKKIVQLQQRLRLLNAQSRADEGQMRVLQSHGHSADSLSDYLDRINQRAEEIEKINEELAILRPKDERLESNSSKESDVATYIRPKWPVSIMQRTINPRNESFELEASEKEKYIEQAKYYASEIPDDYRNLPDSATVWYFMINAGGSIRPGLARELNLLLNFDPNSADAISVVTLLNHDGGLYVISKDPNFNAESFDLDKYIDENFRE